MRAEGFSCSLDGLYQGLGVSKLQFLIEKKISAVFFFLRFLFTKILDPDPYPDSLEMMDPASDPLVDVTELLKPGGKNCLSSYLVVVLEGLVKVLLYVEAPANQYI